MNSVRKLLQKSDVITSKQNRSRKHKLSGGSPCHSTMVENRRSRIVLSSSSPTKERTHIGLMDTKKERTSSKRLLRQIKPNLNHSERSILNISSCKLPSIQVALRIRPFASREKDTSSCIHYSSDPKTNTIQIDGNESSFCFDHVLPEASTQAHVYEACVSELVTSCLNGYNATVLAYGQTGSGKSYTMGTAMSRGESCIRETASIASTDSSRSKANKHAQKISSKKPCNNVIEEHNCAIDGPNSFSGKCDVGVIPRALLDLFCRLDDKKANDVDVDDGKGYSDNQDMKRKNSTGKNDRSSSEQQQLPFDYEVRVQFLELYGEEIRDLLCISTKGNDGKKLPSSSLKRINKLVHSKQVSSRKITIRDGQGGQDPEVLGASEIVVKSAHDALSLLNDGTKRRVVGATAMNSESSRSHAIFSILVQQKTVVTIQNFNKNLDPIVEFEVKRSRFHFVDLAGSERVKKTCSKGKQLKEGININQGLLVLGNVISALGDPKKNGSDGRKMFVPYRESKLTRLLKGSLGGNHKTVMIACLSPSSDNAGESLGTVRYASRVKNIKNNAVMNVDSKSEALMELRSQLRVMALELLRHVPEETIHDGPLTMEMLRTLTSGDIVKELKLKDPVIDDKFHDNSDTDEDTNFAAPTKFTRAGSGTKEPEKIKKQKSIRFFTRKTGVRLPRPISSRERHQQQSSSEETDTYKIECKIQELSSSLQEMKDEKFKLLSDLNGLRNDTSDQMDKFRELIHKLEQQNMILVQKVKESESEVYKARKSSQQLAPRKFTLFEKTPLVCGNEKGGDRLDAGNDFSFKEDDHASTTDSSVVTNSTLKLHQTGMLYKQRDTFKNHWRPRYFIVNRENHTLDYHIITNHEPPQVDTNKLNFFAKPAPSKLRRWKRDSMTYEKEVKGSIDLKNCHIIINEELTNPTMNLFVFSINPSEVYIGHDEINKNEVQYDNTDNTNNAVTSWNIAATTEESRLMWMGIVAEASGMIKDGTTLVDICGVRANKSIKKYIEL